MVLFFDLQCTSYYVVFKTANEIRFFTSQIKVSQKKDHPSRTLRKCATTKRKLWKRLNKQPYDTVLRERYRRCIYRWRKLLADSQTIFEENLITANNTVAFYPFT